MSVNTDFRDLFRTLNSFGVRYLVVGAHAVMYYAEPRYTKDIDIWVDATPTNAAKTWRALARFGAPLDNVGVEDFTQLDTVYQIGIAPNRIDIMMGLPGVRFATAWRRRVRSSYGGIRIHILHKRDLIRAKTKAGRLQDLVDIAALRHPRSR